MQKRVRELLMNRELIELSVHELNRLCILLPLISKSFSDVNKQAKKQLTETIEDTMGEKPEQ
jgi:hypothetical protein